MEITLLAKIFEVNIQVRSLNNDNFVDRVFEPENKAVENIVVHYNGLDHYDAIISSKSFEKLERYIKALIQSGDIVSSTAPLPLVRAVGSSPAIVAPVAAAVGSSPAIVAPVAAAVGSSPAIVAPVAAAVGSSPAIVAPVVPSVADFIASVVDRPPVVPFDHTRPKSFTELHSACLLSDIGEIIRILSLNNDDIYKSGDAQYGREPLPILHFFCNKGNIRNLYTKDIIDLLLTKVNPNNQDKEGLVALSYAIFKGDLEVVKILAPKTNLKVPHFNSPTLEMCAQTTDAISFVNAYIYWLENMQKEPKARKIKDAKEILKVVEKEAAKQVTSPRARASAKLGAGAAAGSGGGGAGAGSASPVAAVKKRKTGDKAPPAVVDSSGSDTEEYISGGEDKMSDGEVSPPVTMAGRDATPKESNSSKKRSKSGDDQGVRKR